MSEETSDDLLEEIADGGSEDDTGSREPVEGVEVTMGEFAVVDEAREEAFGESKLHTGGVDTCLAVGAIYERSDGERVAALAHIPGGDVEQYTGKRAVNMLKYRVGDDAEPVQVHLAAGAPRVGPDSTLDDIADATSSLDADVEHSRSQSLAVDRHDGFSIESDVTRSPDELTVMSMLGPGESELRNRGAELLEQQESDADIEPINDVPLSTGGTRRNTGPMGGTRGPL